MKRRILARFIQDSLEAGGLPCSPEAVELLMMIAAHESGGFRYVRQTGGTAVSLYQIEPVALMEIQRYMGVRPEKFKSVQALEVAPFEALIYDQRLATQAARVYLMRIEEPLPKAGDVEGMARYCKKYWNTEAGKASAMKYATDYTVHVDV